jgi:hypothetical protein
VPSFESWEEYGGQRVQAGVSWNVPSEPLRFQITVKCLSVSPKRFLATVSFHNAPLATTAEVSSIEQATAAANALIAERLQRLFA